MAALVAACTTAVTSARAVDDARRADDDAVAAHEVDIDGPTYAGRWIVVQRGDIVGAASLPDDAVRAADRSGAPPLHRFVFRSADRGPRLYRMAYVAEGGVVVGRKFLLDLGLAAVGEAGRTPVLRSKSGGQGLDLAKTPRFALELSSLDGSAHRVAEAAYDADFDGGLLVPPDVAATLALARFEIPGDAEVQVALGRPFRGRRATVVVKIPAIEVSGAAEVVYEVPAVRK